MKWASSGNLFKLIKFLQCSQKQAFFYEMNVKTNELYLNTSKTIFASKEHLPLYFYIVLVYDHSNMSSLK